MKTCSGFEVLRSLPAAPRRLNVLPRWFEQEAAVSLLHLEAQLPENGIVGRALALQHSHSLLVFLVVVQQVPDGKNSPLADEGVVAVQAAVVQDEGDAFQFPNLVLVVCIVVTEVSNQADEVSFETDGGRRGGGVSTCAERGEVLSGTEDVLTGLSQGVDLSQQLNSGLEQIRVVLQEHERLVVRGHLTQHIQETDDCQRFLITRG